MKLLPRLLVVAAIVSSFSAVAQTTAAPAVLGAASVKVTATVVAIDQANRVVSLKGENGDVSVFKVSPEVKNLAQVKVGDRVTSEYIRAIALELKPGGSGIRSSTQQQSTATAASGQLPAGGVANRIVIMANVTKVDAAHQLVSLRGPKGNVFDLQVKDPATLEQIKVGDQVQATITEAVMVAVTPPAGK